MEATHKILSSVSNVVADMAGFTITTTCHALMLDNAGSDDAKVYLNSDAVNYYHLKAGASLELSTNNPKELIYDTVKITFDTTVDRLINVVKQTKTLIT